MFDKFKNALVIVTVVVLAGSTVWLFWQKESLRRESLALKISYEQRLQEADLELGRAKTMLEEQSKVHAAAMADMEQRLKDEIKKYNALVITYAQLEAQYNAVKKQADALASALEEVLNSPGCEEVKPGLLFYRTPTGKLINVKQIDTSFSDFRLSINGTIKPNGFTPDKPETLSYDHKLDYKLSQRFRVRFYEVITKEKTKVHYATLHELDNNGKEVQELKLDGFEVVTSNAIEEKMHWWNPMLDVSIGGGGLLTLNKPHGVVTAGVSFSGYCKTEDDCRIRFFRLGAGAAFGKDRTTRPLSLLVSGNTAKPVKFPSFALSFSPVQYNIAKHLPLVRNIWLAPNVDWLPTYKQDGFGLSLTIGAVF